MYLAFMLAGFIDLMAHYTQLPSGIDQVSDRKDGCAAENAVPLHAAVMLTVQVLHEDNFQCSALQNLALVRRAFSMSCNAMRFLKCTETV